MASADNGEIVKTFSELVNMTPKALEAWLLTDESRDVGSKASEGVESIGHHSGRRIVKLLAKNKHEFDDRDYKQMQRVIGYIRRHLAQRPSGSTDGTRWAQSLKNWGHDPAKDE